MIVPWSQFFESSLGRFLAEINGRHRERPAKSRHQCCRRFVTRPKDQSVRCLRRHLFGDGIRVPIGRVDRHLDGGGNVQSARRLFKLLRTHAPVVIVCSDKDDLLQLTCNVNVPRKGLRLLGVRGAQAENPGKVNLRRGRIGGERDHWDSGLVSDLFSKMSCSAIEGGDNRHRLIFVNEVHEFIRRAPPGPVLVARDNREPAPLRQGIRSFVFNRQLHSLEYCFTFLLLRAGQRREEADLDFGTLEIMVRISPRAVIIHCSLWNDGIGPRGVLCKTTHAWSEQGGEKQDASK